MKTIFSSSFLSRSPLLRATPRHRICRDVRVRCSKQETITVFDYFLLTQAVKGVDEQDMQGMLQQLWFLQYKVPGVVTSYIGKVVCCVNMVYDHVVFFRFGRFEDYESLTTLDSFKSLLGKENNPFLRYEGILICHDVSKRTETVFRIDEIYETGFERVQICSLTADDDRLNEAKEFLSALGEIAKSPEIGAVESSVGTLTYRGRKALAHITLFPNLRGMDEVGVIEPLSNLLTRDNTLLDGSYIFVVDVNPFKEN